VQYAELHTTFPAAHNCIPFVHSLLHFSERVHIQYAGHNRKRERAHVNATENQTINAGAVSVLSAFAVDGKSAADEDEKILQRKIR